MESDAPAAGDGDENGDVSPLAKGGIDDEHEKATSPPLPLPLESTSTSTSTKGKGLKKWKRIQRRVSGNDIASATTTAAEDLNRILKRDSRGGSALPVVLLPSPSRGDSDNSEDPSSKSSTAASAPAPKFRYPLTATSQFRASSRHSARQQHNRTESTKKLRGGGGVKLDRDLSYSSSVESDLRPPNLFFAHVTNATTPLTFELDNTSDAQASDQHSNDYFFKDNGQEEEEEDDDYDGASQDNDPSSWHTKQPPPPPLTTVNLLSQSIFSLQGVHDALLKEIQNFGEIGHEPALLPDDLTQHFLLNQKFHSVVSEVHETNSSAQVHSEEIEKTSSLPPEAELLNLQHKVSILQRKLEEAMTMLEAKESKVVELEGILSGEEFPKGEPRSSLLEKCREIETELEDLFMKKIEAEVECLTLRKTLQKLKVASEDKLEAFEEQKTLVGEQNKILQDSRHADGNNVVARKEQGNKLAYTGDEVLKMHSGIWKYSLCFSIQLMLLLLAIGMLLVQLWPGSAGFVPT